MSSTYDEYNTYDDYSNYNSQEIQNANEQVNSLVDATTNVAFGITAFIMIACLVAGIFSIVCHWKVYKKAGRHGWESIIPYYNTYVLTEIAGLPTWYFIMTFIPLVNFVFLILIYIELAKKFGKSTGFGFGLALFTPIFMAILAFSKNCVYESFSYNEQPTNAQSTDVTPNNVNQDVNNNIPVQPINMDSLNMQTQQNLEQTQVITKICSNCGSQENSNSSFCTKCGNKF